MSLVLLCLAAQLTTVSLDIAIARLVNTLVASYISIIYVYESNISYARAVDAIECGSNIKLLNALLRDSE